MAGPVTLGGLGSGLDTNAIIQALVQASSGPIQNMQQRAAGLTGAETSISSVSSSLAALSTAADTLSSAQSVGSFTATSSGSAIVATANGAAQPGTYNISVTSLAKEQRTYSKAFSDRSTALGQTGQFTIKLGTDTTTINLTSDDTLDTIAGKINASGKRFAASIFSDGTNYRLQIRGLDTGAANALTFTESGTNLDLNGDGSDPLGGKTAQTATDAKIKIDGYDVTSSTNQIVGAIPGVTLAVTQLTTSPSTTDPSTLQDNPVTVAVATDPNSFISKIQGVVNAYNKVVNSVHSISGFGTNAAHVQELAGDSALRSVTDSLARVVGTIFDKKATHGTLGSIGVSVNRDGTLTVDSTKLTDAFTSDSVGVERLLGQVTGSSTGGAMSQLRDLATALSQTGGTLDLRKTALDDQAKQLNDRAAQEQTRLDAYTEQLRTQFTNMEIAYSQNQSLIAQLSKIG